MQAELWREMNPSSGPELRLEDWQRLAPMSLVFLVIGGSLKFIKENLFMLAGAGAGFAFLDRLGLREFLLLGAFGVLAAVLSASVYHRRFRFRIEQDAIRVRRGLLEVKDLRIRFARVQNVGLNQPLYFRPFGLVRFQLETPGAESAEVELPGIREDLAMALRDRIAGYDGASPSAPEANGAGALDPAAARSYDSGERVHAPNGWRLFMHGLVSNQVWVIAGVAAWLFGTLEDRIETWIEKLGVEGLFEIFAGSGWLGVIAVLLALISAMFMLSGIIAWLRYQGFSLHLLGDRMVARAGWAERREQGIRRDKLTGLTVHQTALGRILGQRYLIARQAKTTDHDVAASGAQFMVPGISKQDAGLVSVMMPGVAMPSEFRPVCRRFVFHYGSRLTALVLIAAAVIGWRTPDAGLALLVGGPAILVLTLSLIYRRWRCWGWSSDGNVCWIQRGLLGLRQDVFALSMVQQVRVVQTPYFRRHGLMTLSFVLPQGEHTLPFVRLEEAARLANQVIYLAETAPFHRV